MELKLCVIEAERWERHYITSRPYVVRIDGVILSGVRGPRTFKSESNAVKAAQTFLRNTKQ